MPKRVWRSAARSGHASARRPLPPASAGGYSGIVACPSRLQPGFQIAANIRAEVIAVPPSDGLMRAANGGARLPPSHLFAWEWLGRCLIPPRSTLPRPTFDWFSTKPFRNSQSSTPLHAVLGLGNRAVGGSFAVGRVGDLRIPPHFRPAKVPKGRYGNSQPPSSVQDRAP